MRIAIVLFFLSCAIVVSAQVPPGFEVVMVTAPRGVQSRPRINNESAITWVSVVSSTNASIRVFRKGIMRQVPTPGEYNAFSDIQDDDHVVALVGDNATDEFDIVVLENNHIIQNVDANDAIEIDSASGGYLVWADDFSGNGTETEVFTCGDGGIKQITMNGLSNQGPRINNRGHSVMLSRDVQANPSTSVVLYYDGAALTQVSSPDVQSTAPDINDSGVIVWSESDGGISRIMCWQEGMMSILVEQESAYWPRINNNEDIVYSSLNDDPVTLVDTVVKYASGETYTLPSLGLGCDGAEIDDDGEVVWRGIDFAEGTSTILMMRRIAPLGDFDHDCRVDLRDHGIMDHCFTGDGNGPEGGLLADCVRADFDGDGDVDHVDVAAFMGDVTGPTEAVRTCE